MASGEPEERESRGQNGKEEVRRVEALLKEILAELKKINEYIDIQKGQFVINANERTRLSRSSAKKENSKNITYQEVLKAYRQYLQE